MVKIDKLILEAMKSQDKVTLSAYRMLKAKIMEFKTQKNAPDYNDEVEINLIRKMVKALKETGELYRSNGRQDLADGELAQASVIEALLPAVPTEEDVMEYVSKNYPDGVEKSQMGIVIKDVKAKLIGVDGSIVAKVVKSRLI